MNWLDMSSEFTQRDAENVAEAQEKLRKLGERQFEAQPLTDGQFPAHYFAKKKDEERVRLIQEYIRFLNQPGQLTDAGKGGVAALYTPTEDDIRVIERKDQEKRLVQFEGFLEKHFNMKNPMHQKLLNDIYPQYYDRRLEIINDNLKLQEKMARLKLYGPQTQEDIFFLFALYQGDIELPTTLASDLDTKPFNEQRYVRGMFNAKKWANPQPTYGVQLGSGDLFKSTEWRLQTGGPHQMTDPATPRFTFKQYEIAPGGKNQQGDFPAVKSHEYASGRNFVESIFRNY